MANKNIDDLPVATNWNAGDKAEILQGGTNKQIDVVLLGGGVQSVTGPQVDNTDPLNPIINAPTLQEVIDQSATVDGVVFQSLDGNTKAEISDSEINFTGAIKKNSEEIAVIESLVTVNITAENDKSYSLVTSSIFTDPTPVAGKGYTVILNTLQTATIGGVAYGGAGGHIIKRYYTGSAWVTRSFYSNTANLGIYAQIASPTFTGTVTTPAIIVSSETASTIASFDGSKNIKSLSTGTYPDLTELSRVKGLSSPIQTQLDAKLAKASNLSDLANSLTARVNLGVIDIHITTGDQTTTSNAASNITDLVSPTLTIDSRYKINGLIRVGCNATGGVKLQITIPTGATMSVIADGNTNGTGGRGFNNITTSATLFTTPVGTVNSVNSYVQISGEISIGATSGTIQFGFASTTNTQLSSIYQLGTNITLIKIT